VASQAEHYDPYAIPTRRMTHDDLLRAADYWGVDAAGIDLEALRARVKQVAEARWLEENRAAIEEWNLWYEKNGHPLADLMQF